mmetsp:Transcript_48828/g.139744  ORF Transcript_48828/g.139744 Transcript_48828/m.139744 type:complete len:351 (-) Transcript_48828:243-1295(-)
MRPRLACRIVQLRLGDLAEVHDGSLCGPAGGVARLHAGALVEIPALLFDLQKPVRGNREGLLLGERDGLHPELGEARPRIEPEYEEAYDEREGGAAAQPVHGPAHDADLVDALQLLLRRLLDSGPSLVQQLVRLLEVAHAEVVAVAVRGRGPDRVHVAMEVVQVPGLRGLAELQRDPGGRLALVAWVDKPHLEALDRLRLGHGPVKHVVRVEEALAELLRAHHPKGLDHHADLLLQRRAPQPQRHDLGEVHDLRQLLLSQRRDELWVGGALDREVEVAPAEPREGQVAYDDVFELHGRRGEAQEPAGGGHQVRAPDALGAARAPREAARPVAAAQAAAAAAAEPHDVQAR